MKIKNTIIVILLLSFALLLTGCGGSSEPDPIEGYWVCVRFEYGSEDFDPREEDNIITLTFKPDSVSMFEKYGDEIGSTKVHSWKKGDEDGQYIMKGKDTQKELYLDGEYLIWESDDPEFTMTFEQQEMPEE